MQSAANFGPGYPLAGKVHPMQSDPATPANEIHIEYSTTRRIGLYSVTNPPHELKRIGKALAKSTKRSVLDGVAIKHNLEIRSIIRNASRGEMSVGRADDCVRLLFNLGILIRVYNYGSYESIVLYDEELMRRFAEGEKITHEQAEKYVTHRAAELIRSAEEREAPLLSEVRVTPKIDIDDVVISLIAISEEETLGDGSVIQGLIREPVLEKLQTQFPDVRMDDVSAWVERAKFDGYLEDIGDGIWRVQVDRKTPMPSNAPSIDDAIARLRSERERVRIHYDNAKQKRSEERTLDEERLGQLCNAYESARRDQAQSDLKEAEACAQRDREARELQRIEEAREMFEAAVARIRREEEERLSLDIQNAQTDYEMRLRQVEVDVDRFVETKRTKHHAESEKRDTDLLQPLANELERLDEEIQSLVRIREKTTQF